MRVKSAAERFMIQIANNNLPQSDNSKLLLNPDRCQGLGEFEISTYPVI